ncbi:MAG: VanZ family protein [Lachnospiraceae bacterium]|nr:VanZ family protein [Lachnospiraceae bacterium]
MIREKNGINNRQDNGQVLKNTCLFMIELLPVILSVFMIFGFSADTGDESSKLSLIVSEKLIGFLRRIIYRDTSSFDTGVITDPYAALRFEPLVRKAAHVFEYALLGLFSSVFLFFRKLKDRALMLFSLCFCFIVSVSDELYQLSVPERSGSVRDVFIDLSGSFPAIALFILILKLIRKIKEDYRF